MSSRGRKRGRSQDDAYDRFSDKVDKPLTVLALLWLPVLVVPLVAPLTAPVAETFEAIDYFIWGLFAAEYVVKLYLSPSRSGYFSHHLLELAVVAVPMLRPLKTLSLAKLLQASKAGVVLAYALSRSRAMVTHRNLHFVLLTIVALVFMAAAVALGFEHNAPGATIKNFGDALWWATITVTTVGYGDTAPVTTGGKAVAVMLLLVAIGLIGVLTATIASYFVEDTAKRDRAELSARLDRIEAMLAILTPTGADTELDETQLERHPGEGR